MMSTHRSLLRALVLVALSAMSGCGLASVSPIIGDADVDYDPALIGTWEDSAGKDSAVITASGPGAYHITYTDGDGKVGKFGGRLGRLGRYRVLDVRPDDPAPEASSLYTTLLMRAHAPVFVETGSRRALRFWMLKPDTVKHYLEQQPNALAHAMIDDGVLITASTPETRAFLLLMAERKGAFGDTNVFRRRGQ